MVIEKLKKLPVRRRTKPVQHSSDDYSLSPSLVAIRRMREDINQLIESFWTGAGLFRSPALDVSEEGRELVVRVDLPGVNIDDIDLQLTDDTLAISAETESQEERRDKGFYVSERRYGSFHRVIPLPTPVKTDGVQAKLDNGVLEVRLPKAKEPKRITINGRGGQQRSKNSNGKSGDS